ncbi:MAG TPA: hypothetical protein VLJ79_19665 [Candidatus Binatia bacterium]|nr:hypothetical protein [Candidatus Binatia bacterium]
MKRPLCRGVFASFLLVVAYVTQISGLTAAADLTPEVGDELQPLITTSELVVGENRFAFGLLKDGKLLEGADVKLRLYDIAGGETKLATELKAPYQAVKNIKQERSVHRHADGTEHVHGGDSSVRGLYIAQLSFARAGDWGVELLVSQTNGALEPVRLAVTVAEVAATPAVGSAAPRSRNLIARDVKNLRQIDTSPRPDVRLHQVRIADAIAQGKPQLIVFATPQFCTSRMCGPVVDIVRTLLPTYGDRVAFTHQEIWQDFAEKKMFPTVEEWRLDTEPWVFVVDGKGIIRAKFEGLVTVRELETALQQILTRGPARRQ